MNYREAFFDELEKIATTRTVREFKKVLEMGRSAVKSFVETASKEKISPEQVEQLMSAIKERPRRTGAVARAIPRGGRADPLAMKARLRPSTRKFVMKDKAWRRKHGPRITYWPVPGR